MCSTSQNHHAKNPEKRRFGSCATAECLPMVASAPQSRNGTVCVGRPAMRASMLRATQAPICLAAGATPGTGLPSCCRLARSPATNTSGCAGDRQIRPARARARRDRARRPIAVPSEEAATPAAQRIVRAAMRCPPKTRKSAPISVTGAPVRTSTPRRSSCARAFSESCSVKAAQHARPGLDQQHARLARIDVAEFVGQRVARDLRQRAREFHAGRPAADHREGEAGIALGVESVVASARSKASRMRRRIDEGVVQVLEPGREALPFIVAEVGMRGAAGDQQIVVVDAAAVQVNAPRGGIDARDLAHEHGDIALLAQDVAQRRGDRRRRQARGRDLVQQRLEQVMVAAIDQRDFHRRACQLPHRPQSAESATDDHDLPDVAHEENLTETPAHRRAKMLSALKLKL